MSALAYVLRRLLYMVPLFLGVSILIFLAMYAAGDPISIVLRGNPRLAENPEALDAIRRYYGLDQPIPQQYLSWLTNFVQLNLGRSIYGGQPVNLLIGSWFWETVKLQLVALVFSVLGAIYLGILSARKQHSKTDAAVTTMEMFGISMPTFWIAIILILVFSSALGWLPSSGAYGFTILWPWRIPVAEGGWFEQSVDAILHLILPAAVLSFVTLALFGRVVRASMLEVLRQDYVLAARASGLPERKVIYSHALRNVLSPLVTLIGLYFGTLIANAPATETVFGWPGLGRYYVVATLGLDFPVIMGLTMIIVLMTLAANLITDLLYAVVDPRVRLE